MAKKDKTAETVSNHHIDSGPNHNSQEGRNFTIAMLAMVIIGIVVIGALVFLISHHG